MSNILNKISKRKLAIIFIFLATGIICMPLLSQDIDMTYDDGIQHICRLMGTQQSIEEGQVFPVIMSNFCNGFGYSWNIFYSPLTAYIPLIFRIIGMNFTNCIKIFMFLSVFLSGYLMYKFVKRVTRKNNVAILAAMLYILLPYRITDMYIRNALAELASFTFLPLVFERII